MYTCTKCGSVYLRESDAIRCADQAIEIPIIPVGTILTDHSYGVKTEIRCCAIATKGHDLHYSFEWQQEGEWEHAYYIHSNEGLEKFSSVHIDT
ncbi:hypothetical protein ACP8HI_12505 [Paenibacillus sp. FA6]|uniref:hypothetical protein n=1 Tax=Paenibacillus sp. FA6 TaxID=3413029 RepID=UPI003F65E29D